MKRAAVLLLLASPGCTVGPDYQEPVLSPPASFQESAANGEAPFGVPATSEADLSQWWRAFNDPELDSLVARAFAANLDLQAAASRILVAREQEIVQGAAGLPTVNATGAAVRLHSNSNPLGIFGGGGAAMQGAPASSSGADIKLYSAGFDATWEADIFGGVRRSVEAARAGSDAAMWELRDAQVSLSAEVANDYLNLRATQERIAIIQSELQRQRDTLGIIQARFATGFVTGLDVDQQTAQVEATAAQLPPLQAQEHVLAHAIAVLIGVQPEAMSSELQTPGTLTASAATLPIGLPSDLLRRRPDVREAERKLAAATAQIGVAVADLYPKFNLIAVLSFAGNSFTRLLSSDNFGQGGIAMITWPIFNGGKTRATIRIDEEQENQAYLAYQQSVLRALQDTEDALSRYTTEQQRLVSLQQSIAAANSSFIIAQDQYITGLATYQNVLTAETALLNAEDAAAQSRAALATDIVALYKALGGGWATSAALDEPSAQ